jgi:hypothetical protein
LGVIRENFFWLKLSSLVKVIWHLLFIENVERAAQKETRQNFRVVGFGVPSGQH